MENFDQEVTQPSEVKLVVTEEMRSYIYDATKWCKLLAIVGIVVSIFLLIGSFGIGALINADPKMQAQLGPLASAGGLGVTIFYLLMGLLYFYPSILLYKFANKGKQGVLFGDQASLNEAFLSIKSLFKFMGILTIVLVATYFIFVLVMGAGLLKM
ncbi:hypothetical protein EZJ43_10130 [Pedobacter changchengzhani]|uniref:DUF5362 domain-containing protein n=1 Tax=Pedobacter changchengzhani TaxID=2529274 RepID=A0A4R5MKE8_9SPHI|nr:DUF5362 family protein [Pedobacter changchengzhani]TDG36032.1 hypothetical protein EZJ43_10130 [Pedobacter changchengzhani]